MSEMEHSTLPKKGLVSRLTKLFSGKRAPFVPKRAERPERLNSIYLGDVLDADGSVVCEAGPLALDKRTSQILERYRSEARAAAEKEAPAKVAGTPKFAGNISEIVPDGDAAGAATHLQQSEQGIREVSNDHAIRAKYGNSPLSTYSSFGGHYDTHSGPASVLDSGGGGQPGQQTFPNFLFLESMASEQELHAAAARALAPHQGTPTRVAIDSGGTAESVPILDSWDEALFGAPGDRAIREAKPTTKKRLLATESSASKLSSCESAHSQPPHIRSPKKQHRNAAWTTGSRSRGLDAVPAEGAHPTADPTLGGAENGAREGRGLIGRRVEARPQLDADVDVRRVAEVFEKQAARHQPVHSLRLSQVAGSNASKGERTEVYHPRQQRREARQREKERALLLAQEQNLNKQRHAPAAVEQQSKTKASIVSCPTQPLQDTTGRQRPSAQKQPARDYRTHWRPNSGSQKAAKVLGKYADLDSKLHASLQAYEGVPNLLDESDSSPEKKPRQLHTDMSFRAKPLRRVHFTDDQILAAERPPLAQLPEGRAPRHDGSRGTQKLTQSSVDANRPVSFWSEENEADVLAEALAMSASFSHDNETNKPGGPLSSPSRFLKLASQPSEGKLRPPTSQDQAWDAQVNMQLDLAKPLAAERHQQHQKAQNRMLQCVSSGMHDQSGRFDKPRVTVTTRLRAPSNPLGPSSTKDAMLARQAARSRLGTSSNQMQKPPAHHATHSSTTMLMKTAAARTSYPPPPTRAQVQTGFAAARAAILQAEARRMPILTSSKTGPIWTAPPGGADWEQSTITSCMPEESLDLDSYPVSIPPSPGSLASVHGHALSHVTFSPGRQGSGSMWSSSQHEEPWAPEMQAVVEDEEGERTHLRSLAEMSALSFRSGLHSEPCSRLTQATLETRALLDTVACDVDLGFVGSIWPAGHTPSTTPHLGLASLVTSLKAPRLEQCISFVPWAIACSGTGSWTED